MTAKVIYLHRCEVVLSPGVDDFREKTCQSLAIDTIDGHCFICPKHIEEFVRDGLLKRNRHGKLVTR